MNESTQAGGVVFLLALLFAWLMLPGLGPVILITVFLFAS
jgi:hypothetical protein